MKNWRRTTFLVNTPDKLNELNVTLYGDSVFTIEMYNAAKSVAIKINMSSEQLK